MAGNCLGEEIAGMLLVPVNFASAKVSCFRPVAVWVSFEC